MRKRSKILIITFIILTAGSITTIFGILLYINTPSVRHGYGMVYDASVKKVILFGGGYQDSSSYSYYGDTWSYDPNTNIWSEIPTQTHPSARSSHSMVYDPINQKIILFGGVDLSDNWLNDTWIFNSRTNTWTEVYPENNPPIRGSASIFYDNQAQKVIIFGGYRESGGHLDDTWVYDYSTNNWTNLDPIVKPTGRYGAPMIYDPINQRGLMFGGSTSIIMDDTWVYYYSNNTWSELTIVTRPANRYWEGLAYDESAHKVILFGGRTPTGGIGYALDDTWAFDPTNNQWIELNPTSHPTNRFHITLVYEPERKKTIVLGGFRFPDVCLGDTWGYDYNTNNWNNLK